MIESLIIYIAILLTVGFLIIGTSLGRILEELTKPNTSTRDQEPPITRRGRQI